MKFIPTKKSGLGVMILILKFPMSTERRSILLKSQQVFDKYYVEQPKKCSFNISYRLTSLTLDLLLFLSGVEQHNGLKTHYAFQPYQLISFVIA